MCWITLKLLWRGSLLYRETFLNKQKVVKKFYQSSVRNSLFQFFWWSTPQISRNKVKECFSLHLVFFMHIHVLKKELVPDFNSEPDQKMINGIFPPFVQCHQQCLLRWFFTYVTLALQKCWNKKNVETNYIHILRWS